MLDGISSKKARLDAVLVKSTMNGPIAARSDRGKSLCAEESRLDMSVRDKQQQLRDRSANSK
jgi:hypothetical protein